MAVHFHFTFEPSWRTAPMAFWVHVPTDDSEQFFDPPAPVAVPHKGYPVLRVAFETHELQFSAPAQLDHAIDVLSRKPLPTSSQLSAERGEAVGPNQHWLSRLPGTLKSPRNRPKLVQVLAQVRAQVAEPWSNLSFQRTPNGAAEF